MRAIEAPRSLMKMITLHHRRSSNSVPRCARLKRKSGSAGASDEECGLDRVARPCGVEGGKPYSRRERFVDTWLLKRGNWVCVGTDATPVLH
jgi:hypothetical protein